QFRERALEALDGERPAAIEHARFDHAQPPAVVVDRAEMDGGDGDDERGDGHTEQPAQRDGHGQDSCSFRFRRERPPAAWSRRDDGMSGGKWQEQWVVVRCQLSVVSREKAPSSSLRHWGLFALLTIDY